MKKLLCLLLATGLLTACNPPAIKGYDGYHYSKVKTPFGPYWVRTNLDSTQHYEIMHGKRGSPQVAKF